jgi:hypothetical protein
MLLLQTLVYVVTQTPWMFLFFYSASTIYISNKSTDRLVIEQFISFAADMTAFLLPVLSFYLSTLASRTFRHELMKVLRCPVRRRWRNVSNRIHPLANDVIIKMYTKVVHTVAQS